MNHQSGDFLMTICNFPPILDLQFSCSLGSGVEPVLALHAIESDSVLSIIFNTLLLVLIEFSGLHDYANQIVIASNSID